MPIARGFWCFSSDIRRMSSSLKSPRIRTMPGAIRSAPLQMWGMAPMSTMILGRSGRISSKKRVGISVWLGLASMGLPLRRKILVDWTSATSMRRLEPRSCWVSTWILWDSSWRISSVSFSRKKCLFMVPGI